MRLRVNLVMSLGCFVLVTSSFGRGQSFEIPEEVVANKLLDRVFSLWDNGEIDFLGHNCRFSTRPGFYRWELVFKGKFFCPGFVPFSGSSRTKSAAGAVEHATKDFVHKGIQRNVFDEEEVKIWLDN